MTEDGPRSGAAAWRTWAAWAFRLALTLVITVAALRRVPLGGLRQALLGVNLPLAGLSVATFMVAMVTIEAVRFQGAAGLLEESQPRFRDWAWFYVESRPFFYILPASMGTEGMVWMRLRQFHWRHASCGFAVLSTRLWGMGVWALGAAAAFALLGSAGLVPPVLPPWISHPAPWACGGGVVLASAMAAPHWMGRRGHLALKGRSWRPTAIILAATFASMAMSSLTAAMASRAAGTPLTFLQAMGLLAMFNFVMILPISLGGVGIQEALILQMGLHLGYRAPGLLAFSLVLHLQRLTLAALGLGLFLSRRPRG